VTATVSGYRAVEPPGHGSLYLHPGNVEQYATGCVRL